VRKCISFFSFLLFYPSKNEVNREARLFWKKTKAYLQLCFKKNENLIFERYYIVYIAILYYTMLRCSWYHHHFLVPSQTKTNLFSKKKEEDKTFFKILIYSYFLCSELFITTTWHSHIHSYTHKTRYVSRLSISLAHLTITNSTPHYSHIIWYLGFRDSMLSQSVAIAQWVHHHHHYHAMLCSVCECVCVCLCSTIIIPPMIMLICSSVSHHHHHHNRQLPEVTFIRKWIYIH